MPRATTKKVRREREDVPQKLDLDLGSSDESAAGDIELKINTEYAKKFEHNKKREELHHLEEKYGKKSKRKRTDSDDGPSSSDRGGGGGDGTSSSDEEEDEFGVFADEVADADIMATIKAIRSKDPRIYDGQTRFFNDPSDNSQDDEDDDDSVAEDEGKQKPMYLKDYHRKNLLSVATGISDEEDGDKKPKTYLEQQDTLKRALVRDMHNAAEGIANEEDDDDDFLRAKERLVEDIPPPPDPSAVDPTDPDAYLTTFLASKAWLPKDRKNVYGPAMESDDSEEEEAIEQFEQGFNLRFEDPSKAAQLVGHARGAVKVMSARKEGMSARKRARELKKEKKEEERKQREIEKGRLRALKVEELMKKVKKIKQEADLRSDEDDLNDWKKLLEGEFSDEKWDKVMQEKFGNDYYGVEMEKPEWDDDIDISDIEVDVNGLGNQDGDEEGSSKPKRKSRKAYEKERREQKTRDKETRKEIEKFVDENIDLDEELSGKRGGGFRYREVTPETFGLTPMDILAADDTHLNEYAGLKVYAPFREKDRKKKDKKKYSKKRNLREWRKAVFGDESGPKLPPINAKEALATEKKILEFETVRLDGGEKKKRRRRRGRKAGD